MDTEQFNHELNDQAENMLFFAQQMQRRVEGLGAVTPSEIEALQHLQAAATAYVRSLEERRAHEQTEADAQVEQDPWDDPRNAALEVDELMREARS